MLKRGFSILLASMLFLQAGMYADAKEPQSIVVQEAEVSDETTGNTLSDEAEVVPKEGKSENKTIDTKDRLENTDADLKETTKGEKATQKTRSVQETPTVSKEKYTPSVKLSVSHYAYNGKTKKPEVIVKDKQGNKVSKVHYTVKYAAGRKNVGRYAVTVSFKGDFTGKAVKYFRIVPNGSKVSGISKKDNSLTIRWNRQKKQISGYQIQYSTNKKFQRGTKTVTIKGSSRVSKKLMKLRGNKKYYVRVRTYKTVKSQGKSLRLYSGWSKVKSAKTGYKMPSGKGVLTKSKGVNYYKGRRETWYSQRVLRGGGLKIPGRHVGEDGTIRDKDNYICISSSGHKKGKVLRTSLGLGKVYDTGCAKGTIDVYVDW